MRGQLACPVREGADGKGPEPRAPRRRPTSLGGGPSEKALSHRDLAGGLPDIMSGSDRGPLEKDPYGHLASGPPVLRSSVTSSLDPTLE